MFDVCQFSDKEAACLPVSKRRKFHPS